LLSGLRSIQCLHSLIAWRRRSGRK
jgi:hypothetical protein